MYKDILEDLKQAVQGRLVLTPVELQAVLGVSEGQQANLRSQKRFPIVHKKIGSSVVYPIHAIAKHLSGEASKNANEVIKQIQVDKPLSRIQKKKIGNHLESDWMHTFRLRLFAMFENNEIEQELIEVKAQYKAERKTGIKI